MNRDRLEQELTRFEEEILSGLDKNTLLPHPLLYPNRLPSHDPPPELRPLIPANPTHSAYQHPPPVANLLNSNPAPPPNSVASSFQLFGDISQQQQQQQQQQQPVYSQPQLIPPLQGPYLPPQPMPLPTFCLPTPQMQILPISKPPTLIPSSVLANAEATKEKLEGATNSLQKKTHKPVKLDKKKKKLLRSAAGQIWLDNSMEDWDPEDYRIFCGDLGNEVNDDTLHRAFSPYKSLQKVKVIRDKRSHKSKGYGFASFKDPKDFLSALREVNGRYIGNRPVKLRKSIWKDRSLDMVRKKTVEKKKLGLR